MHTHTLARKHTQTHLSDEEGSKNLGSHQTFQLATAPVSLLMTVSTKCYRMLAACVGRMGPVEEENLLSAQGRIICSYWGGTIMVGKGFLGWMHHLKWT